MISPISTSIDEPVFSFVTKVCSRHRGLGSVYVDWIDAGDQLQVFLSVTPMFKDQIYYTDIVSGSAESIDGAASIGKVYQDSQGEPFSLSGDVRSIDELFFLGRMEGTRYDYVETVGEQMEVAVTASLQDTDGLTSTSIATIYDVTKQKVLAPRWSLADLDLSLATPPGTGGFEKLTLEQRVMARWDHVYQAFGLPRYWTGKIGNGLGTLATNYRADYRCKDDGSIQVPADTDPADTDPCGIDLSSYLPFYHAYDYSGAFPKRVDNSPSNGMPARRQMSVYLRLDGTVGDDRWYLPQGQTPETLVSKFDLINVGGFNPSVSLHPDVILCSFQEFSDVGQRALADVNRDAALDDTHKVGAFGIDVTRLAFTVSLRLPHRVRFCSADASVPDKTTGIKDWTKARRKKTMYVPNVHLWLAHKSCIWDLDQTAPSGDGWVAKRAAGGATDTVPGILRDDRGRLQPYHLIAAEWYLKSRRKVKFGLQVCPFLPYTRKAGPASIEEDLPQLGHFLDKIEKCGAEADVNTTITEVHYDHQAQTAVFTTDYFDLEFSL
jgi:hypothetical protein